MPRVNVAIDEPQPEEIPEVDTRRETREGRVAGALGILSVIVTFAALPIGASDVNRTGGASDDRTFLLDVGSSGGGQLAALVLRCLGLLLVLAVIWFLYRAIRGRNPEHRAWVPIVGAVATLVIIGCTAYTFFQVRDIGREFVGSGPRTLARAQDLLDAGREESTRRIVNVIQGLAALAFGVWISLTSLEAMRVGLLTRFLGVFGIGAGLTSAIGIPVAPALFIAWIGSVSALAVGYWPGGRPLAWDAGRAVSWDEADAADMSARAARREERRAQ
jgi:hypothetical protein